MSCGARCDCRHWRTGRCGTTAREASLLDRGGWNRTFDFSLKSPVPGVRLSPQAVRYSGGGGLTGFRLWLPGSGGRLSAFRTIHFPIFRPVDAAQVIGVHPLACDAISRRPLLALGFTKNGSIDNQRVVMREPLRFHHGRASRKPPCGGCDTTASTVCEDGSASHRRLGLLRQIRPSRPVAALARGASASGDRGISHRRRWDSPCPVAAQRTRAWEVRREPMGEPATTRWEEWRDILARREASGTSALRSCQRRTLGV